ncbi:MAG: Nudix family hydrolase [Silanimonas lenta]
MPPPPAAPPLHVVAAVLRDDRGRVLLARRPAHKTEGGLWEFPGGKVEPGEEAGQALRRELQEELGIEAGPMQPLIRVPVAGGVPGAPEGEGSGLPPLRLRLDTWVVAGFQGRPRAREHAELVWAEPAALATYPMPLADHPVRAALTAPEAILVTPGPGEGEAVEAGFLRAAEEALARGLRRLHLRLPDARAGQRARLAEALAPRCRAHGAALYVHGDAPLAARLGLGLHLRHGQLFAADAEALCAAQRAAGLPLSAACHDAASLRRAEALGVQDLLLGPVAATPTHPGAPVLGWEGFEALRALTALPVYALGGLGPGDLSEARRHGAQGVAGIRGFWPQPLGR